MDIKRKAVIEGLKVSLKDVMGVLPSHCFDDENMERYMAKFPTEAILASLVRCAEVVEDHYLSRSKSKIITSGSSIIELGDETDKK